MNLIVWNSRLSGTLAAAAVALLVQTGECQGQAQRNEPEIRPIIFTVSGGISRGAYQGGLNWGLVELARRTNTSAGFRDAMQGITRPELGAARIPRLWITAAAGASAGNINGLLSAIEWCRNDAPSAPEESLFWKAWVWTGWDQLTWNSDILREDEDGLFDRRFFQDVLLPAVREYANSDIYRADCRIPVGVTTTRVRPDTIAVGPGIAASSQRFVIPFMVWTDSDRRLHIVQAPRPVLEDPSIGEALVLADPPSRDGLQPELGVDGVFKAVEASSAYPVAFGPRTLTYHKATDVRPGGPCRATASGWSCDSSRQGQFTDGGVFDNNPLGLAYALHRCVPYRQPSPVDPPRVLLTRESDRTPAMQACKVTDSVTIVYIDPDARRDKAGRAAVNEITNDPVQGLSAVTTLVSQAVNTAREYELAVFNRMNKLLPRSNAGIPGATPAATDRFQGIVGDYFNAFGAFLGRPFREYDFYVGVYDALYYAGAEWLCVREPHETGATSTRTRDCVQRFIAAAACNGVFDRLDLVGRAMIVLLLEQEFDKSTLPCADASFTRDTAAASPATRARIHVLTAIGRANERIRATIRNGGDDPFACKPLEFLEETLCKGGFRLLLDALKKTDHDFQLLHEEKACEASAWKTHRQALDACHSDETLPALVDHPADATDSLTAAALKRLELVESGRSYERAVELLHLAYDVGVEPNLHGLFLSPSSIPREGSLFNAFPYHVSTLISTRSTILGHRSTYYQAFGVKRLQMVTPLEFMSMMRHINKPGGGYTLDGTNAMTLGAGLGWLFGNKVVENVQATAFCSMRTWNSPSSSCIGGEVSVSGLLNHFRLGYRVASAADRGALSRERSAVVVGLSDVNGLAYWITRLAQKGDNLVCGNNPQPAGVLAVGQSASVWVRASDPMNKTGIGLVEKGVYRFEATGKWKDGSLPAASAAGNQPWHPWWGAIPMTLAWPLKRNTTGRWFELTGMTAANHRKFRIGDRLESWQSDRTGELLVFANDVNNHYGNNQGCVRLTVSRIN